ncbi:MAG: hypothetical protein Q7U99_11285 [Rubrivivax sp.]|nr:hypothetical protein [Rubrivivax sp.]
MAASWTRHPIVAGVIGVLAGALAIMLVEWLAHQWLGKADLAQPATISTPMFASVLVAWVLGAGTAALVATAWNGGRSLLPGLVAAGVLLAGSVATMFAVAHPLWMVVGASVLMPAAAWLGARSRLVRSR